MTVLSIVLTDPVSGSSVTLMPADGIAAQTLDVNTPARAITQDRVNAHGSFDVTKYYAASAVSLAMILYPASSGTSMETLWDTITPFLDPALRPYLIVTNDQWGSPRRLPVRYDSTTKPFSDPTNWPVQISWVAPGGVWEDVTQLTATVGAFVPSTTGLTWDPTGITWSSAGVAWPASTSPSPSLVINPGTANTQWQASLYGPCTGPKLASDAGALEFDDGLVLNAGEYVLLDSVNRTAYRNSNTGQSVIGNLTYPATWFPLHPGTNNIRYYPTAAGGASAALLTWYPARPA